VETEAHLLLLAHEFFKDTEIENFSARGISCSELLVQSVDLRAAFKELDEASEILKVEVIPLLRVCLL
jgi:hypothetical protein